MTALPTPNPPGPPQRSERLDFRLVPQLKEQIEQAAALTGQTVAAFAVATLGERAREVLAEHNVTQLTDRDRDRFLAILDADVAPNEALRAAASEYNAQVEQARTHKVDRRTPRKKS